MLARAGIVAMGRGIASGFLTLFFLDRAKLRSSEGGMHFGPAWGENIRIAGWARAMYQTLDDGEINSNFAMPPGPALVPITILAGV